MSYTPYIVFLFVVALPIALWLWFIRWEDRSEPEPGRLMRRCFYVGIGAVVVAAFTEVLLFKFLGFPDEILGVVEDVQTPLYLIGIAAFFAGPVEELIKYIVLRYNAYFSHDFNQVFDGVVYGITIALAFSFVENIFYFIEFYTFMGTIPFVLSTALRSLFSTLVHVTATGIAGYYVGRAKFSADNRGWTITKGVVYASLLHGCFNFLVVGPIPGGLYLGILLSVISFALFVRIWSRPGVRMVWQYVPAPKH